MAKMISPHEFKILHNIAIVLRMLNKKEESVKYLEEAMKHVVKGQEQHAKNLQINYKRGKYDLLN